MDPTQVPYDDFIGRGWSFPPTFEPVVGVHMTEQAADIDASLHILLTTLTGERIMQPRYGCNVQELLFEPLDTTFLTHMKDKIETAILYFESRIKLDNLLIESNPREGKVLVQVDYTIKGTNSRFNFVYPFYVREGTELIQLLTQVPPTDHSL
ncbi:GPW/gp25 family protein [Rhabdobacter roseus]|uniref:IraD/Gp25-like domain-containing protein n=1 Tax=Rhabdobacter roseus TaxID=1655419 RepID=A0A840TFA6_9BACT|nr:GPW/gp25 family protein [Rhabdobacter roseus]MBB5282184.1 hypothetical protein [Rhabdobacter roseus]